MSNTEEQILQISLAQLRSQKEDLRNFRNQAGFMSATSGIIATVFASLIPDLELKLTLNGSFFLGFSPAAAVAFSLFSLSLFFAFRVVISWREFNFDFNIDSLYQRYGASSSSISFISEIAKEADDYFVLNEIELGKVRSDLFFAGIFAFSQVPVWLVLLV